MDDDIDNYDWPMYEVKFSYKNEEMNEGMIFICRWNKIDTKRITHTHKKKNHECRKENFFF